ncbi:MAG: hypothetical protein ACRELA_01725 [Candidatus Rokuibacteriota bacterium]
MHPPRGVNPGEPPAEAVPRHAASIEVDTRQGHLIQKPPERDRIGIGDHARGLSALEEAVEAGESIFDVGVDPRYDPLRSEPRFQEILRRVGLQP